MGLIGDDNLYLVHQGPKGTAKHIIKLKRKNRFCLFPNVIKFNEKNQK